MRAPGVGGVRWTGRANPFPSATERAYGNQLPGITGSNGPQARPAPGYWHVGGQVGGTGDGAYGSDPRAAKRQPWPVSSWSDSWSEGQVGTGPGPAPAPVPYGGIQGRHMPWSPNTGIIGQPDPRQKPGHESFRRNGVMGFNDKLTTKDRHAYWDTGYQRTGLTFSPEGANPNAYNNPLQQPPAPELRLVNRTVSFQIGSDKTRNQDDLTRPYNWLGEQGSKTTPVYGGVPGLYQPYGTRGGVPFAIVSPVPQGSPQDGPRQVDPGPPHGLHSSTPWKGGAQIIRRFMSTPQTRPVRLDRPSNSPQAGQSYSQTVRPQGASRVRPARAAAPRSYGPGQHTGRGWAGRQGQ